MLLGLTLLPFVYGCSVDGDIEGHSCVPDGPLTYACVRLQESHWLAVLDDNEDETIEPITYRWAYYACSTGHRWVRLKSCDQMCPVNEPESVLLSCRP